MAQPPQSYSKISIAQPCKKRKGKGRQNGGEAQPRRRKEIRPQRERAARAQHAQGFEYERLLVRLGAHFVKNEVDPALAGHAAREMGEIKL